MSIKIVAQRRHENKAGLTSHQLSINLNSEESAQYLLDTTKYSHLTFCKLHSISNFYRGNDSF